VRVLFVTGVFPPDIGGPASYVPRMATALHDRGHDVQIVTLADRSVIRGAPHDDMAVHRIERQIPKPIRMLRSISLIRAKALHADLIYANGLVLEAIIAGRLAAKPVVVKVVGDLMWERARNAGWTGSLDAFQTVSLSLRWRALRVLQNAYMRMAKVVITPSEYLKRIVVGWGVPADRVSVVYNAVPEQAVDGSVVPDVDIVSVGRLVPWKGFGQLIEIAARRDWSLSIVGDGPLRRTLENRTRTLGARVRFEGHLAQAKVADAIRRGKVFVLNSSYEGLPHIVLESMAAGVPVVATAAGGTPETIADGETGRLVPVDNETLLEQAIASLLEEPEVGRALAGAARKCLADRFSVERMVGDTERLLLAAQATCETTL
jgi:glycosyltransferase involved in cell wall biosynthesis